MLTDFIQLIKHYTYKMVTNPDNICILAISNVDMFTEVQTNYYDRKIRLTGKEYYTSNPMTEPNSLP